MVFKYVFGNTQLNLKFKFIITTSITPLQANLRTLQLIGYAPQRLHINVHGGVVAYNNVYHKLL